MMTDADTVYHWVKDLPIVDWHNHLDVGAIAADRPFGSLYEVWVKADPYKHRAMRICGVPERLITGDAPESEKMAAWEATLPKLVGNPLFTWSRMEMDFLKAHPLETLTPKRILKAFKVEYASPCMTAEELGRRASCPSGAGAGATGETPIAPEDLGRRASCPSGAGANATGETPIAPENLGRRASCPSGAGAGATGETPIAPENLGRRASCPSGAAWTAAVVREFPCACADTERHYSPTLAAGTSHRRHYPHIGQDSTLVCVTFRLADSLSGSQLAELEEKKREWLKAHPEPWDEATGSEWRQEVRDRIDKWLDAGRGSCILADERCRKVVEEALEFFNADGQSGPTGVSPVGAARYRLHSYIVMPNHVHVLFELFVGEDLPRIIQSWKSFTAKRLNELLGRSGKVWREEYFDRLIRDPEHYENVIRYIRQNGEAAKTLARIHADGQDARRPSAPGPTGVSPVGGRPACDGQDARRPGETRIAPSLRMNVGERIPEDVLERFHSAGCRVVDISVDNDDSLDREFDSLSAVAGFAAAHGWTMLLHMGALRSTSDRLRQAAGPAGGYAGMRAPVDPQKVARFLNRLESMAGRPGQSGPTGVSPVGDGAGRDGQDARRPNVTDRDGQDARRPSGLPRTILMTLNPEAHAQLAVLAGSFVEDGVPGKVQLGPAWWWCDHRDGIFDVFEKTAAYGVLSTFVGMTTDSRSFLSFVRHDYFRRLFARWMAQKVADGDFPDDEALLRPIAENVCYRNAADMVSTFKHSNTQN